MSTRYDEMVAAVNKFHEAHPRVWELFNKFTQDRISKGFKNYSVNAIFERIRWETDTGGNGKDVFKLNNNYRAFYARAWMKAYPKHKGFFRLRKQISGQEKPSGKPEQTPQDYPYETI